MSARTNLDIARQAIADRRRVAEDVVNSSVDFARAVLTMASLTKSLDAVVRPDISEAALVRVNRHLANVDGWLIRP